LSLELNSDLSKEMKPSMQFIHQFLADQPFQPQEEDSEKKESLPQSPSRGNKIYWTDQELEEDPELPFGSSSFLRESWRKSGKGGGRKVKKVTSMTVDNRDRGVGLLHFARGQGEEVDRQLQVFSPDSGLIEDRFQRIVTRLPNVIDNAKNEIVKDIAQRNMLGYTIVLGYFSGAFLDTIADLMIEERFWWAAPYEPTFLAFVFWVWGYAGGFSTPFIFPDVWASSDWGGDPGLACSSQDFFRVIMTRRLHLNIRSLTDRSRGEMLVLTENLRRDFSQSLSCILAEENFRGAKEVEDGLTEMLDLIVLHHELTGDSDRRDDQHADLAVIDRELAVLLEQLPQLVLEAGEAVYSWQSYRNLVYLVGGFSSFLGWIGSVEFLILPKWSLGLPSLLDFMHSVKNTILSLLALGQFQNDLGIGNALFSIAQSGWGYGYCGIYFFFFQDTDPGCGLVDFQEVLGRFQELHSIDKLLSGGNSQKLLANNLVTSWQREECTTNKDMTLTRTGT